MNVVNAWAFATAFGRSSLDPKVRMKRQKSKPSATDLSRKKVSGVLELREFVICCGLVLLWQPPSQHLARKQDRDLDQHKPLLENPNYLLEGFVKKHCYVSTY